MCLIALAVAPCKSQSSPMNLLRRLRVSDRSGCGAVQISTLAEEPSAEIVCVCVCVSHRSRCGAACVFETLPTNPRGDLRAESLSLRRRGAVRRLCVAQSTRQLPKAVSRARKSPRTASTRAINLRRGFAETKTNSHGATARALRRARSPQRVACAPPKS